MKQGLKNKPMKKLKTILALTLFSLSATAFSQSHTVDIKNSTLKWTGKKVAGTHYGEIQLKEGSLDLKGKNILGGSFVIDMNTMTNTDLDSEEWQQKLVDHLMSEDFFGVKMHPLAKLVITKAERIEKNKYNIEADLTIKDITKPIKFTAIKEDDTYSATITVDRTDYGIRYGSGKFFDKLGDNMI